jgi:Fur family ferric uptake transcriptional regulator
MPLVSKNPFTDILRKAGYKATPSRLAVLSFMQKSKKPLSAQGIIERMDKNCDPVTVYRIIKNLALSGIIKQIDLRHNHAHYELVDQNDHHHLICTECGRMEDIAGCEIEEMHKTILRKTASFSEIQQHSLEFYGLCKGCALGSKPKEVLS